MSTMLIPSIKRFFVLESFLFLFDNIINTIVDDATAEIVPVIHLIQNKETKTAASLAIFGNNFESAILHIADADTAVILLSSN